MIPFLQLIPLLALRLAGLLASETFTMTPPAVAPSSTPHTCRWSFPGGVPASSSSCSPAPVRFQTPGLHQVTLTVCAAVPGGRCSTVTKRVNVLDPNPFVVNTKADPAQPYVGDVVRLTATAAGKPPFSWSWALPPSTTVRTNPALWNTVRLLPGLFTLRVRVTSSYGSGTRALYLNLRDPKPVLTALSLSSTTPAIGSLLVATPTVTGRPPLAYLWTLEGREIGTDPTLAWRVAGVTAGSHTLALRVSNTAGSASLSRTLTVRQPLILAFRPLCPSPLCLFPVNTAIVFDLVLEPSARPIRYDYDWTGNGTFTESSPTPVGLHTYPEPGNYRPRVRVTTAVNSEVHLADQFLLVTR